MKNQIRNWSFMVILLFSYQCGIPFIFSLPILSNLSDVVYYFVGYSLVAIHGLLAGYFLYKHEALKKPKWKWRFLGVLLGAFGLILVWSFLTSLVMPVTRNQEALNQLNQDDLTALFFVYAAIIAPITEELVFRGLILFNFKSCPIPFLDRFVSASLFSLIHVLQHGFLWTDFIRYFGIGWILVWVFKKTGSVYYSIVSHMSYNLFLRIIMLFFA
ncbi:CPBP family intramembrane glutamic endopeptidase [Streptococcus himalayensis]|uniref:CAAX amino protease n=1 Tax=Streptococcus himalayensis TaxID=1888195 RepID=A0A917A3I4_9STRE|nr:type II CAAX endopeptidase family protein [Streptococcus himalayensis]GGE24573.1 CAAX amino protease [Streptococcus himalayensis]